MPPCRRCSCGSLFGQFNVCKEETAHQDLCRCCVAFCCFVGLGKKKQQRKKKMTLSFVFPAEKKDGGEVT